MSALLQQLRDIHLPPTPSFWPLAPGWIVLGVVVILFVVFALFAAYRWWRQYRVKYVALRQMNTLILQTQQQQLSTNAILSELSTLLKRVGLAYFPRGEVAGLQGAAWLDFLDSMNKRAVFSEGVGSSLISAPYQAHSEADLVKLLQLSKQWIKTCRSRR